MSIFCQFSFEVKKISKNYFLNTLATSNLVPKTLLDVKYPRSPSSQNRIAIHTKKKYTPFDASLTSNKRGKYVYTFFVGAAIIISFDTKLLQEPQPIRKRMTLQYVLPVSEYFCSIMTGARDNVEF